ncbi:MAG: hypothetical protein QF619_13940 [Candidatus Binatia bacterium]|nr:hypothetical protein [Candidatus Binatia bacterium]
MQVVPSSITKKQDSFFPYLFGIFFLLAFFDSWHRAEVNLLVFFEEKGREHLWKFVTGMFPPEFSGDFLSFMYRPTLETIQISVMGTLIAVVLGFPLGILATRTLVVGGILNEAELGGSSLKLVLRYFLYGLARSILSLFRCIPEFVWAFMFVRAVGLGPSPGVLAIGVAFGGMLGK